MNAQMTQPKSKGNKTSKKTGSGDAAPPVAAGAPAKAASPNASSTQAQEVVFEFEAGSAREVLLAGDFTAWDKTPIRLTKKSNGQWATSVKLAPGQYHYKFLVDGIWTDDPRARVRRPNPFGSSDSVLEVK
jgi:1,4-alpha-glucan branching enzyme